MEKVSMEDFERIMSKIWNSGIKSSKIGDFFYTYSRYTCTEDYSGCNAFLKIKEPRARVKEPCGCVCQVSFGRSWETFAQK